MAWVPVSTDSSLGHITGQPAIGSLSHHEVFRGAVSDIDHDHDMRAGPIRRICQHHDGSRHPLRQGFYTLKPQPLRWLARRLHDCSVAGKHTLECAALTSKPVERHTCR